MSDLIIGYTINETFKRWEVLDVDIGVRGRKASHVDSIQHYWDHIVGQNFPEFLGDIILTERILQ